MKGVRLRPLAAEFAEVASASTSSLLLRLAALIPFQHSGKDHNLMQIQKYNENSQLYPEGMDRYSVMRLHRLLSMSVSVSASF